MGLAKPGRGAAAGGALRVQRAEERAMSRRLSLPVRSAWEDKYRKPEEGELIGEIAKAVLPAFEFTRGRLAGLAGVSESLEWQGFPWRWSLVYRRARGAPGERALAYLVPQPSRPLLVVPVPGDAIEGMERRRIARPVRDLVHLSPVVGPVRWSQFEVSSKAYAEEVLELVRMLHESAPGANGAPGAGAGVRNGSSRSAVLLRH